MYNISWKAATLPLLEALQTANRVNIASLESSNGHHQIQHFISHPHTNTNTSKLECRILTCQPVAVRQHPLL